jgi:uncharacterized membrane protein
VGTEAHDVNSGSDAAGANSRSGPPDVSAPVDPSSAEGEESPTPKAGMARTGDPVIQERDPEAANDVQQARGADRDRLTELLELAGDVDDQVEEVVGVIAEEAGVDRRLLTAFAQVVSVESRWSGPLPPPKSLAQYEELLPGSADRILQMTEGQIAHRQELEKTVVVNDALIERRGQIISAITVVLAIILGALLIYADKDGWGFAVILSTVAGVGGTYLYSRNKQGKELQARRAEQDALEAGMRGPRPPAPARSPGNGSDQRV